MYDLFSILVIKILFCLYLLRQGRISEGEDYGRCTGPIWLDDVKCQGDELSLTQCLHSFWGEHDCTHTEDAGCVCTGLQVQSTESQPGTDPPPLGLY